MTTDVPICILHIGKTGGTFLRSVLRHNRPRWTRDVRLNRHDATRMGTLKRLGPEREFAFVTRDPVERFVSAFYSRLREGRPTFNSNWSAEEAIAYQWFEEAEELALALNSKDQRLYSAARFAMRHIQHLGQDHRWYLGSALDLLAEREQIAMCVDLSELNQRLPQVMARLGVPEFEMPPRPKRHEDPMKRPPLSHAAEAALRDYWAEEFELYEVALAISKEMWGS